MRDYVKEAEENLVNICKTFKDFFSIVNAMQHFGYCYCSSEQNEKLFFEGLSKIRAAMLEEHRRAEALLLGFVGVGGSKAKEYSIEKFKEYFDEDDRQTVMHFLDRFGQVPHTYLTEDDKKFREQAKALLDKD
jgi:Mn-dependent DtxR family transcriptional regulator